jgi:hypothetical protein
MEESKLGEEMIYGLNGQPGSTVLCNAAARKVREDVCCGNIEMASILAGPKNEQIPEPNVKSSDILTWDGQVKLEI